MYLSLSSRQLIRKNNIVKTSTQQFIFIFSFFHGNLRFKKEWCTKLESDKANLPKAKGGAG